MSGHEMTIRVALDVYEELRRESYERHVPMNRIINEALKRHQEFNRKIGLSLPLKLEREDEGQHTDR